MSITGIFLDTYNVKLSYCNDMVDYTSCYQIVFDKISSQIYNNEDFWISRKIIEITLQGNLFGHLEKDYFALILAIKTM